MKVQEIFQGTFKLISIVGQVLYLSIQLNITVTGRWSYKYRLNGERKVTGIKHSCYMWKRNRL